MTDKTERTLVERLREPRSFVRDDGSSGMADEALAADAVLAAARIEVLEAALRPFAAAADSMMRNADDDWTLWGDREGAAITVGDVRRARAVWEGE